MSLFVKAEVENLLRAALETLDLGTGDDGHVERTRDAAHGDFASNAAMKLSKRAGRKPRELATEIVAALPDSEWVERVEVAGPGFVNFFLASAAYHAVVEAVLDQGQAFGRSEQGSGQSVLVEFVSANPTGPLHVGHGRGAAYGDSVASLLQAAGFDVTREYYVNDAGRQMDILALSVWLRYLELCGEGISFPANAYQGDYIRAAAARLREGRGNEFARPAAAVLDGVPSDEAGGGDKEKHIDKLISRARALLGGEAFGEVLDLVLSGQLEDIRADLTDFNVRFDRFFSERRVVDSGAVDVALTRLRQSGFTYEQDGAVWFRSSEFGDEKDRVVVRAGGQPTYLTSDIAYHLDKLDRGFDRLVDILGADHHGYVARLSAAVQALAGRADALAVQLVQFVSLYRGKEKLPMSTRAGEYVTLRHLREEVGTDAARFFYVLRSNDQHLDFDLELATSTSNDNPVYYIQYAHARVESVLRQLQAKGWVWNQAQGLENLGRLSESHEQALFSRLSRYPEVIEQAARTLAPHTLAHYLRDLADDFHSYYNAHTFLARDADLRNGRLCLALAVRQVIRNGLSLLGVSAPESM
jgi:arginyl-tRNA synthetase